MKEKIVWLAKAFVALVVAFCILSGFCSFYYNLPVHLSNPTKATDYYWEENSCSIKATEGFARVRVDDKGFVNTYEPKGESIDVLVMGSSHTEGFNVGEKENYTYLLNEKFSESDDLYFYNIGISGHTFQKCLYNLEAAINEYNPQKYIVIEAAYDLLSSEDIDGIQNGTVSYISSNDSGLVYYLQKSNLFRLLYAQFSNVLKNEALPEFDFKENNDSSEKADSVSESDEPAEYERKLDAVLKESSELAKNNGCKLIVAYMTQLEIDYSGTVCDREIKDEVIIFESICEKYDIGFIDLYDSFADYYEENDTLLQGFSNTKVGVGHINKYGHAVIADELYAYIKGENDK